MAISYVSYGRPQFDLTAEEFCQEEDLVLFDPRIDLVSTPIGNAVNKGLAEHAESTVVIRGSGADFPELLERDSILPSLLHDVNVFALGGREEAGKAPELWRPAWAKPVESPRPDEAELCSVEVRALLEGSGAIFREKECHYVLPSRFHAKEFVRLAETLCDTVDTIRLLDWITPYLRPDSTVVGDTGSMLTLLFALRAEAMKRFGWDIPIATLSEYPADFEETAETIEEMQALKPGHMLLLISVSSSGKVAEIFETLAPEDHDVLVVCDTATEPQERVALTRYPITRWEVKGNGECDKCDELHQLVVDEHSYEVRPDIQIEEVMFDRDFAERQGSFWKLADKTEAISLHFDRRIPGDPEPQLRHMAVHVDIEALLGDEEFRDRVRGQLAALRFDRVLVPGHQASSALRELLFESHPGLDPDAVHVIQGVVLPDEIAATLRPGEQVLILDDALVSGKTLISLRRDTYRKARGRHLEVSVDAFVVLCRPRSDVVTKSVRRTFGMPGESSGEVEQHFSYAEEVLLPPDCAWCDEQQRLKRLLERLGEGAPLIRKRIQQLEGRDGLAPPFLLGGEAAPSELTLGSFFGELSPLAAFAAATSAGQQTRVRLEELRRGPRIAILNVPLIAQALYEPPFVAGLMRTLPRRLARHANKDAAVTAALNDNAERYGDDCLGEIAWAAATNKIAPEAVLGLLNETQMPALRALAEALTILHPGLSGPSPGEEPGYEPVAVA